MKRSRHSPLNPALKWQLLAREDIFLYARSFRKAAETMMRTGELDPGLSASFDACPIVFMYRMAVELNLKALVLGDGGNFLTTKPDRFSVYKTHSVSWLAQVAVQIVNAVGWEGDFKCDGIASLADR